MSSKQLKQTCEGNTMPYLTSNIPYFKAWVRKEYTKKLEEYHGEFLHCMVVAVTTMPNKTLSFQVIFTGCEADELEEEVTSDEEGEYERRMRATKRRIQKNLIVREEREKGDDMRLQVCTCLDVSEPVQMQIHWKASASERGWKFLHMIHGWHPAGRRLWRPHTREHKA